MPELPEVETVVRGLNRLVIKKKISKVEVLDSPKSYPNSKTDTDSFLIDSTIKKVRRRAKMILVDLSTDYTLAIHLKMTGQLVYVPKKKDQEVFGAGHPNDSLLGNLPDKSTRVVISFDDKSHLYFNDQRKFGWIKLIPTIEVENLKFMQTVGPEPLEDSFTLEDFKSRFSRKKRSNIKSALLDQTVIAGIGNIYADETLWSSKIDPRRLVQDLSDEDYKNLYENVRSIMNLSIEKGGSTSRNYINAEGKKGNYLNFANVYGRAGEPCNRCGEPLKKIKVASRGTQFCQNCQK